MEAKAQETAVWLWEEQVASEAIFAWEEAIVCLKSVTLKVVKTWEPFHLPSPCG